MRNLKIFAISILSFLFAWPLLTLAQPFDASPATVVDKAAESKKPKAFECPVSHISDQDKCFSCHTQPSFKLMEAPPDETMKVPFGAAVRGNVFWFRVQEPITQALKDQLVQAIAYMDWHPKLTTLEIDIMSWGGDLFAGFQMAFLLEDIKARGVHVITKTRSIAASAAFTIFMAGDERLMSSYALLWFHEAAKLTVAFESVSDSEEKARIMRLIQDDGAAYVASKSKLTVEQLTKLVRGGKNYVVNGPEALKVGFATGLLK